LQFRFWLSVSSAFRKWFRVTFGVGKEKVVCREKDSVRRRRSANHKVRSTFGEDSRAVCLGVVTMSLKNTIQNSGKARVHTGRMSVLMEMSNCNLEKSGGCLCYNRVLLKST